MTSNRRRTSRMLRYAWAAPCSFVGLLLTLVAILSGATARTDGGALEVAGGRISPWLSRLPRGLRISAITFGHVILGVSHASLAINRAHEHVHVRQYEQWGVLFFPLYCGSSLIQLLRGRNPYLDNRFEREARLAVSSAAERANTSG